jgi:hypothetical protein
MDARQFHVHTRSAKNTPWPWDKMPDVARRGQRQRDQRVAHELAHQRHRVGGNVQHSANAGLKIGNSASTIKCDNRFIRRAA